MRIELDLINIILIVVAVVYLLFAYLISSKGKNKKISNLYLVVIFSVILWTISMIIYRASAPENTMFWVKALYITATFTASSFFIFSKVFPHGHSPGKKSIFYTLLANFAIIILVMAPDVVIKGIKIIPESEKIIIWGKGYFLYVLYISGFFSLGLFTLFNKYRIEKGESKSQLVYVFFGYFLGSNLAMVTNLLMVWWGDFRFNWLGQVLTLIMVGFTVYAIVVHRLMDIRLVLRRGSVYLFSFLSIIFPIIIFKYIINKYAFINIVIVDYLLIAVAVIIFPKISNYFYHLSNKYFFSSLYDTRELIAGLSDKLSSTLLVKYIYKYFTETIVSAFHCKEICFIIFNEKKQRYYVKYKIGFFKIAKNSMGINKDFHDKFIKHNKAIVVRELLDGLDSKYIDTVKEFTRIGAEIVVPLNIKNSTIGVVMLGAKVSNEVYNSEDIEVLEIIGAQSAIAIANALHYEEIKNFSRKMEREVKKATLDLGQANIKLKQLDEAKSEFVSIASHQLRTPLTIIKGYISMMLEGNFGKMTSNARDSLEKVFESNERLIHLVENLLNISRIESGRLKFNYEYTQLEKLVGNVIEEMNGQAKNKNLKLTFARPKKTLPIIKIDQEKIRQVIMNLVDNAIKYSSSGEIKISLKPKYKSVVFCVEDEGMGIKKKDILDLFDKFTRGTGTDLVHTEGTGLGLFVARQMIISHNGEIWAESAGTGKGSMFCFKLPTEQ